LVKKVVIMIKKNMFFMVCVLILISFSANAFAECWDLVYGPTYGDKQGQVYGCATIDPQGSMPGKGNNNVWCGPGPGLGGMDTYLFCNKFTYEEYSPASCEGGKCAIYLDSLKQYCIKMGGGCKKEDIDNDCDGYVDEDGVCIETVRECENLVFSDGEEKMTVAFDGQEGPSYCYDIVSKNKNIKSGSMKIKGLKISETIESIGNAQVVLSIDISPSMDFKLGSKEPWDYGTKRECDDPKLLDYDTTKLSVAKCVSSDFIDSVLEAQGNEIGIVSYNYNANKFAIMGDKDVLKNHVKSLKTYDSTCICCGIKESISLLEDSPEESQKSILLLSDGEPTAGCYYSGKEDLDGDGDIDEGDDAIHYAKEAANKGIVVYSIGFGEGADEDLMKKISEITKGSYYYAEAESIAEIFKQVSDIVRESYASDFEFSFSNDVFKWNHAGELKTEEVIVDLEEPINNVLVGCTGDTCNIGICFDSSTKGNVELGELEVCYDKLDNDCDTVSKATISLHKGWNLLPITLDPDVKEIDQVLEPVIGNVVIVREYSPDGIKVYDPGIPLRFNTLKEIEYGKAYQIKMKNPAELTIKGQCSCG